MRKIRRRTSWGTYTHMLERIQQVTGRQCGVRTIINIHRLLSVLIIIVIILGLHDDGGLNNAFLSYVWNAVGSVLVRLTDDLLERFEFVGVVNGVDGHAGLLAKLKVVRMVGNVLLRAISWATDAALAAGGGHGGGCSPSGEGPRGHNAFVWFDLPAIFDARQPAFGGTL